METITDVRQLCKFAAETYGEKTFCKYLDGKIVEEKSFREFYENCLSVCAYIRSESRERLHIAFIGKKLSPKDFAAYKTVGELASALEA